MPISTYNTGQKVLGHSLFFTCFVWNLQLTGNIATASESASGRRSSSHSPLLSRVALAWLLAIPLNGVLARRLPEIPIINTALTRFLPSSRTKMWPIIWARFEKECLTSKTQHCPAGGRVNLNSNFLYMKDKVSQTFCPGLYFTSGINT